LGLLVSQPYNSVYLGLLVSRQNGFLLGVVHVPCRILGENEDHREVNTNSQQRRATGRPKLVSLCVMVKDKVMQIIVYAL
jgi:hypothetical protein